jgi:hypothetical protein
VFRFDLVERPDRSSMNLYASTPGDENELSKSTKLIQRFLGLTASFRLSGLNILSRLFCPPLHVEDFPTYLD